ncbi:hypothetical protein SELMODRAFT_451449 [Selaginella moellendorffii]|uniref:Fungal lipase-type domain-containing protein n=1 Tax=Selaginella moellendorffii TaxID=88036 RepID=D8RZI1_SELML|nr:sn1-specific diacylglycerol lipase beta [Selaginella moellendorffii]EFJ22158.1 hypothetical protein SELMODRAFT_451449 [Selaginella moellendorffii]|eukprot:XP_002976489.1 sn1-specific diacylglycerol lipase beta [Selaginella moellendorffii]
MWKLILVGCGICGAYFAGRVGVWKLKEQVAKNAAGAESSPMTVIAKGVLCVQDHIGPWSAADVVLGLAAMAKITENDPMEIPGHPSELASDPEFMVRAQHWRAMAEAVYVADPASFSLFSHLPESSIVTAVWNPEQESMRPAFALSVDHSYGALVLSVRGTSHVIDILVSAGAMPAPFESGHAHGGFARATDALLEEVRPHIRQVLQEDSCLEKLVIVGHSMGAAVGIMCGLKLRDEHRNLECWGFSVPASVSLELAKECASFATSFVCLHDVVPRFSVASIEDLRKRVCNFDWKRADEIANHDEDWQKISRAVDAMQMFQRAQDNVDDFGSRVCSELSGGGSSEQKQGSSCEEGKCEGESSIEKKGPVVLYPPGRLLVLSSSPPGCGVTPGQRSGVAEQRNYGAFPTFEQAKNVEWTMHEASPDEFSQMILSPWAVSDHVLGNVCEGINFFVKKNRKK